MGPGRGHHSLRGTCGFLGSPGLLLGRSDSKAPQRINLRNDQLHLENPRTTRELSTTPAGHYEIDLLNRTSGTAIVESPSGASGNTVKVLTKDGNTSQVF